MNSFDIYKDQNLISIKWYMVFSSQNSGQFFHNFIGPLPVHGVEVAAITKEALHVTAAEREDGTSSLSTKSLNRF